MDPINTVNRIRAYRAFRKWSIQRLAREAGLGESTIRQLDADTWNPTFVILQKLHAVVPTDFMPEPGVPADLPGGSEAA